MPELPEVETTKNAILPFKGKTLKRIIVNNPSLRWPVDEKAINNRMKQYETEMSHRDEYNHIVINDNFENCISEIESIINQHREKIK